MASPRVSILLPTLQGERELARLLPALARQRLAGGQELLAIDSSSDDRTLELLRAHGAAVEVIPRADFGHGRTRNALARRARGEFLVYFSQDAEPTGDDFLERLLAPFADEHVAGVYARHQPREDDDPLTRRTVLAAREASPLSRVHEWHPDPREAPSDHVHFNNVASALRRSVFERFPFPDVPFGEDLAWATRVFVRGWRIAFAADAVVLHSHRYGLWSAYQRYRIDASFHRHLDGHRVRPSFASALKGVAYELACDLRFVRQHGGLVHLARAPFLRAAQVLGQWRGSQDRDPSAWRAALDDGPR